WDYDGDGDYDLFRTGIGSGSDSMMLLFPNVGTPYAPAWGKMVALDTAPLIYTGTYDNHYRQDLYTFADADADGLMELFVQQQDGTISAYQCYEGTDTIPPVFDWLQDDVAGIVLDGLSGVQPRGLALADFNYSQDGILELFAVYSSTDGGRMAYTVQDAAKDVTTWVAPTVGAAFLRDETGALMNANRVESLAAADLNRDGRPDLIVTLSDDLSVEGTYWECSQHVYLNTYNAESGNFSFVYSGRLDTPYETDNVGARMVSAIDIDADSDDDVFLGHQAYYPDSVGRRHYLRFYRNATDLNMAFWRTRAVSGQTWTLRVGDREPEYEWISNASGGSVEGAVYTAGPTGRVVDILQTTDAGYPYRVFIDVLPEVGEDESKAIIVVGGAGDDSLYPAFEDVAAYAYWVLRGEGLPPENIRMYAQNDFDADDDGISDVVGPPTLDALEESVTEWAVGADRLLVTLIDHGQRGRFRLNGVDYLDADEYAEWINELQPSGGGPQVTTVIDTCEAGSFIAPLALTKSAQKAGTKRITMTSSGVGPVDGVALFDNNHGISFSAAFWEEIFQGSSYGQAFEVAKVSIESINPLQDPQIDGDGDGVANGASDALAAYDARPGAAFEVVKAGVFIGDVADFLVTSTDSATLWLKNVVTDFPLEAAGALVVPPNFQRPTLNSDDEQPVTGMDWVQFTYNAELDRWQADYDGFTEGGMFRVQYYVKAAGRFHASTRIGTVDRIGAPDAWEADNTAATAKWLPINSVQGHNFDVASDEDWVRFTSPANMNGTIAIVSPGLNCRAVVELYKQSELDANPSAEPVREMTADKPGAEVVFDQFFASSEQYCLRIANNDPNVFGAGTSYMMLIAVGTGGDLIPTTLVVSVMDSAKAAPIVGAEVVFNKTVKGNTAGDGIVQFVCPTYGSYDIGAS
ncbi:MAG: hypothetical protein QG656_1309, partial [Candidatus Hydrogenedentes bacterium]|nr:hypothetical protein [Candidatus Hydrogenedentota bacterium]